MTSVSVVPDSVIRDHGGSTIGVDRLPDEMNDMRIRDDKVPTFCIYFDPFHIRLNNIVFLIYIWIKTGN